MVDDEKGDSADALLSGPQDAAEDLESGSRKDELTFEQLSHGLLALIETLTPFAMICKLLFGWLERLTQ